MHMVNRIASILSRPPTDANASDRDGQQWALSRQLVAGRRELERQIATRPVLALVVAVGIGMVSGWVIKRRK